jgi:hypothetical protein
MGLIGLIEFIAGTKAKAQEVNSNFNTVKSFVNGLEADIALNTTDISNLESNKADLTGNPTVKFNMDDAVNNTEGVNKRTLFKYTHNSQRYINGLFVVRSNDTSVTISEGSAMDSTFTHIMVLNGSTVATNTNQGASTTYYVYLISKEDGTTQCIISPQSVTPSLPSGYLYFRQIGSYVTDKDNKIIDAISTNPVAEDYIVSRVHDTDNNSVVTKYASGYIIQEGKILANTTVFPVELKSITALNVTPSGSSGTSEFNTLVTALNDNDEDEGTPDFRYIGFDAVLRGSATTRFYEVKGYYR